MPVRPTLPAAFEGAEELNAAAQEVVASIGAGEVDVQALVAAEG